MSHITGKASDTAGPGKHEILPAPSAPLLPFAKYSWHNQNQTHPAVAVLLQAPPVPAVVLPLPANSFVLIPLEDA